MDTLNEAEVRRLEALRFAMGPIIPYLDDDRVIEIALNEGLDQRELEWLVSDGDPCSALLRLADPPSGVDLLVVGSRGSGRHAGSLLGSTSLELVEHSNVPVVVVPSTLTS